MLVAEIPATMRYIAPSGPPDDVLYVDQERPDLALAIAGAIKTSRVKKSEVAARTRHTWATVNNWCTGKHRPSAADLEVVEAMTGASLLHLLTGADVPDPPPYP